MKIISILISQILLFVTLCILSGYAISLESAFENEKNESKIKDELYLKFSQRLSEDQKEDIYDTLNSLIKQAKITDKNID